ncbi:secreted protein [Melampsora americana]|nr:secreted protein [Melampsora americana]
MSNLLNSFFIVSLLMNLILTIDLQRRQDFSGLPSCGQSCLVSSLATSNGGCSQSNFACLCKSETFLSASAKCYAKDCSITDAGLATAWGVKTCASIGITLPESVINSANSSNGNNSTLNNTNNTVPINSNNSSTAGSAANSMASGIHVPPFEMMLFFLTILIFS